jgi:hypothetical protein
VNKDNELHNDDGHNGDEDNEPKNRHIYSSDAVGPNRLARLGNRAFFIRQDDFKEWARVRLDGKSFNNADQVQGSRASDRIAWHSVGYYVKGADGFMTRDVDDIGASFPKYLPKTETMANGTASVTTTGTTANNKGTEGWTLTYADNGTKSKWTIQGKENGVVVAADNKLSEERGSDPAANTTWTISLANRVDVVITQGATHFKDGDEFTFATFSTSRPGGKLYEIALGTFDDVKGDATDMP